MQPWEFFLKSDHFTLCGSGEIYGDIGVYREVLCERQKNIQVQGLVNKFDLARMENLSRRTAWIKELGKMSMGVGSQIRSFLGEIGNWLPLPPASLPCSPQEHGSKKRLKRHKTPDCQIAGLINKNLLRRSALCGLKTSRSPHLPVRILKVYTEVLTGFSSIFSQDGLNNT